MTEPHDLEAKWERAIAFHKAGRPWDAEPLYREILVANPNLTPAWNMLGIVRAQQGRAAEALIAFDKAVAIKPDFMEGLAGRASMLWTLGRYEDAVSAYDKVLAVNAANAEFWNYRGGALSYLGRTEEALTSFAAAVTMKPDYLDALNNQGATEQALGRFAQSLQSFDRLLAIKPDHAEALSNRGVTLSAMERFAQALESIDKSLAARPDHAEAQYNRAGVLADLGRFEEALEGYACAIALRPDYAEAHYNQSLCQLLLGQFDPGWQNYEWRKRRETPMTQRRLTHPEWLGESAIAGKTLLLSWEQGLDDTLQFCRYAKLAAAKGAKVYLSVQAPLVDLLRQCEPAVEVIGPEETPPQFDYHSSLMSMPLAFAESPIPAPPYLKADADLAAEWETRLPPKTKPRIGLVWSSAPDLKDDGNRSIGLEKLLPLLTPDAHWISLQGDIRESDLAQFQDQGGIAHFGETLRDFRDAAALMEHLDLVISVDGSAAHLAGAMGKPVWILLPWRPDWRWQLGRDDSPWYPSARLLRQPARGDWAAVVERLGPMLAAWHKKQPAKA